MNVAENPSSNPRVQPLKSGETQKISVPYTEHEAVIDDYAASEKEVRRLRREVNRLQKEQTVTEDSPEAAEVQALLDLWWIEVMDSDGRVLHGLDSTRAAKVRAAVKRRRRNQGDYGFEMCRRAVLGVRHDDWAMGRVPKSKGKSYNDIAEQILDTDGNIEKFAKLYDQHHPPGADELDERRVRKAISKGVQLARQDAETDEQQREVERVQRIKFGDGMVPFDRVLISLRDRGSQIVMRDGMPDTFEAQCPAHDDRSPSLGVRRVSDGTVLVLCRAGCETADVLDALSLQFSDLWENSERDDNCLDAPFCNRPQRSPELQATLEEIRRALSSWGREAAA